MFTVLEEFTLFLNLQTRVFKVGEVVQAEDLGAFIPDLIAGGQIEAV